MYNSFSCVLFCILILPGLVFGRSCDDIGVGQAYQVVSVREATVCFVYTETPAQKEGQLSRDPEGIAVYEFSKSEMPKLVYEFPYSGTKGKINDAFILSVNSVSEETLFVIHSVETPSSWDVLTDTYDVSVFVFNGGVLTRDELLSGFFDMGGDMKGSNGNGEIFYRYPYKDRGSVVEGIESGLFEVVGSLLSISGVVKEKAFLYDSDSEPVIQEPSKLYLIKGDLVTVENSMAGWCKISYVTKIKPIKMWMQCKSIGFPQR